MNINIVNVVIKFLIIFIFFILLYSLWSGKNGILDYCKIKNLVDEQIKENNLIEQQNIELFSYINNTKTDLEFLEEIVRKEFNLIKSNEIFYMVIDAKNKSKK